MQKSSNVLLFRGTSLINQTEFIDPRLESSWLYLISDWYEFMHSPYNTKPAARKGQLRDVIGDRFILSCLVANDWPSGSSTIGKWKLVSSDTFLHGLATSIKYRTVCVHGWPDSLELYYAAAASLPQCPTMSNRTAFKKHKDVAMRRGGLPTTSKLGKCGSAIEISARVISKSTCISLIYIYMYICTYVYIYNTPHYITLPSPNWPRPCRSLRVGRYLSTKQW